MMCPARNDVSREDNDVSREDNVSREDKISVSICVICG